MTDQTAGRPKDKYILIGPDGKMHSGCRNSERSRWIAFLKKMPDAELDAKIATAKLRGYRVEKLR